MLDFSKVELPQKVNCDFVLSKVDSAQIFYAYFGEFVPYKRVYKSVFRRDSKPSTGFYYNEKGKLVYKDFGTGDKYDCFAFVAKLYNLTYGEAIKKIACDFGLINAQCSDFPIERKKIVKSEKFDKKIKEETTIQVIPCAWTKTQLDYWADYWISKTELEENNVFAVKKLYLNKKPIRDEEKGLRFAYLLKTPKKEYMKIYAPFNEQFKWISNIPLHIPFGVDSLKYDSDTVIITKSVKELILWKKFFSNVIATQNESESSLNNSLISHLCGKFKQRIIAWDADEVGVENCKKFNDKGFGYINTPRILLDQGIKDFGDLVKVYGLDGMKKFLKTKNLI